MKLIFNKLLKISKGNNIKGQLVRGAMGVGGLKILSIPIALVASVLIARFLGPEGYGKYSYVMAIITVLSLPVGAGIKQLVTREVALYEYDKKWSLFKGLLKRSHQWVAFISSVCILIMLGLSVYYAEWKFNDNWTLLVIAIFTLPLIGFKQIRSGTLRGLGSVVSAQIPDLIVVPGVHLINVTILIFIGMLNPATAIFSQILGAIVAFIVGTYLLYKKTPSELVKVTSKYESKKWLIAWVPFTLLMAVNMFNNQIGIILLGWLGTDEQVGALRVADKGSQLVSFSLAIVNMVISPFITKYFKENDKSKLQKLSRQSARAALVFALPLALPMIFFGAPIINLVFGEEYVDLSVTSLAILASAQLISVIFGSVGMFLTMSGFEKDTLFGQICSLAINVLLAILLIPNYGADGAAFAAAIGVITWNLIMAFKFKQRLNLRPSAF
ncbi:flippase [Psychroflexus maritimus]|uniref:Flippase n=1 Tax=Psychroflexus maritimus TaxID=2714865 RepID=A0A967AEJ9_9FLAO|nr:flippase [Psychroflexus maritimus]NGZ90280.1 flippase [Psychroflexus maritimus]